MARNLGDCWQEATGQPAFPDGEPVPRPRRVRQRHGDAPSRRVVPRMGSQADVAEARASQAGLDARGCTSAGARRNRRVRERNDAPSRRVLPRGGSQADVAEARASQAGVVGASGADTGSRVQVPWHPGLGDRTFSWLLCALMHHAMAMVHGEGHEEGRCPVGAIDNLVRARADEATNGAYTRYARALARRYAIDAPGMPLVALSEARPSHPHATVQEDICLLHRAVQNQVHALYVDQPLETVDPRLGAWDQ